MTFADRLRALPTNPLAMAGLGLLSMPTQSRHPINPLQYGLQGMQGAYQNQQVQAEMQMRQALAIQQQREFTQRQAEYDLRVEQSKRIEAQRQAQEAAISALPPQVQGIARMAPAAYAQAELQRMYPSPAQLPNSAKEFEYAQQNPEFAKYLESQRPAPASEPLEKVMGPNGPILVPRSQARGMTPFSETSTGPKLTDQASLRKEFNAGSKPFMDQRAAFQKVEASRPTAAGDLGLVFAVMRSYDPASTVRESEQASAQNATGVPDQIRNQWNRMLNGERLTPEQREDFKAQARAYLQDAAQAQELHQQRYKAIAERGGFNPSDIVTDYIGKYRELFKGEAQARAQFNQQQSATRRGRLEAMQPSNPMAPIVEFNQLPR